MKVFGWASFCGGNLLCGLRETRTKKGVSRIALLAVAAVLGLAVAAPAQTTYTQDTVITDFIGPVCSFAGITDFSNSDGFVPASPPAAPFTPTGSELATQGYRVYNGTFSTANTNLPPNNNYIVATFASPVSAIWVFANIDHYGSAYDGYQYNIFGSNDLVHWTPLFDALSVNPCVNNCVDGGQGEPFTLGTFTGTPPSTVNNVETPGAGPAGTVGYEALFNFCTSPVEGDACVATPYMYYAFGASTVAVQAGNPDQELSAVGTPMGPSGGSCQRQTLNYNATGVNTQVGQFLTNGDVNNPASNALGITFDVVTPFTADVVAHFVPTDLSTGQTGVGINDGDCENGSPFPPPDDDLDCRLAEGGFVYATLQNGDRIVPHVDPYGPQNTGVWYRLESNALATDQGGNNYNPGVVWTAGWNQNPDLDGSPNPANPAGWNNQNQRFYDRHDDDPSNAIKFDITQEFNVNCTILCAFLPNDQGGVGGTHHKNDVFWGDVPNPLSGSADTIVGLIPLQGSGSSQAQPFKFYTFGGKLPLPIAFVIAKKVGKGIINDPNAIQGFHSVNVATLALNGQYIQTQPFGIGPSTVSCAPPVKICPVYFVNLSAAPYALETVYTLQIGSDLAGKPVNFYFEVEN